MSVEGLSKLTLSERVGSMEASGASVSSADSSKRGIASPVDSLIDISPHYTYNISGFDKDSRRRARKGLLDQDKEISMKFCEENENTPGTYHFNLADNVFVEITEAQSPKCSCGQVGSGKACEHIFWLLGKLTTVSAREPLQLAEDGSSVQNMHPADIILKVSLGTIANSLGWRFGPTGSIRDEDEILDEIADTLWIFEPMGALPSEFKDDDMSSRSELSRKYKEFHDLLGEFIERDFLRRLQQVIPSSYATQVFFDRVKSRLINTWAALEEFRRRSVTHTKVKSLDVESCAKVLLTLVNAIDDYYDDQQDHNSNEELASLAITWLIKILSQVLDRGFDIIEDRPELPLQTARQQNLVTRLICEPSAGEGLFVLDALRVLPPEIVLSDHRDELLAIEQQLYAHRNVPAGYLIMLRSIVHGNKRRAASEEEGNSPKRLMR